MFHLALLVVLAGAVIHVLRLSNRTSSAAGEAVLRWVLVGYCGIPMVLFMGYALVHPAEASQAVGMPAGSPYQTFAVWALIGMGIAATLALRIRGAYLVGPAIAWSVFFLGATAIHMQQLRSEGGLTHGMALLIFATHGLISVVLLGALWASGLLRGGGADAAARRP
ncbi:MAG: DUF6790 family protein [Gemmatimonadota bacterium]